MAKVTIDGQQLDAAFSVAAGETPDQFVVTINSSSGPKQNQPGVNRDYKPGFDVILARLGAVDAVVQGIWLAPTTGARPRTSLDVEGRPFPWHMSSHDDFRRLRLDIGRAQELTSREPGARGSGNRPKRVEILVRLKEATTAGQVEAWLSAQQRINGVGSSEVPLPENRAGYVQVATAESEDDRRLVCQAPVSSRFLRRTV